MLPIIGFPCLLVSPGKGFKGKDFCIQALWIAGWMTVGSIVCIGSMEVINKIVHHFMIDEGAVARNANNRFRIVFQCRLVVALQDIVFRTTKNFKTQGFNMLAKLVIFRSSGRG